MAELDVVMQRFESCVRRLEQLETRMASNSHSAPSVISAEPVQDDGPSPPSVAAYKAYYGEHVKPFVATCKGIGGDIGKIADLVTRAFDFVGVAVSAASSCKKPDDAKLRDFIEPLSKVVQDADASQDNRSKCYNHQAAFAEAIQALLWVVAPSAPQAHVQTQLDASVFYLNKVLSQFTEDEHKNFVKQIRTALIELKAYVKAHHTTGLEWNAKGSDISDFKQRLGNALPVAPALSLPPPPPPAPTFIPAADPSAPTASGMAAVFAEINQGSNITKHLNKVTADMKSKNRPASQRSGLVPTMDKKGGESAAAVKSGKAPAKKPASITHSQGKWFVENFTDNPNVQLPEGVLMTHTVYIYKCEASTIRVNTKIKAVCIDTCKRSGLLVADVVSTVEVVNCQSVEVGITGVAPSISVDKTHGCQLILSQQCIGKDPSIVTSNISEVNVRVPGVNANSDPVEMPIPEQFITKLAGSVGAYKLNTQHVSHG